MRIVKALVKAVELQEDNEILYSEEKAENSQPNKSSDVPVVQVDENPEVIKPESGVNEVQKSHSRAAPSMPSKNRFKN